MQALPEEPTALERVDSSAAQFDAVRLVFVALIRSCTATGKAYLAALERRNDALQDRHSNLERAGDPAQYSERDRNILDAQSEHVQLCIAAATDLKTVHAAVFADLLAAEGDFDAAKEAATAHVRAALQLPIVPDADAPRLVRMLVDLAAPLDPKAFKQLNRGLREIHFREAFTPRDRAATPSVASYRCTRYCASDWSSIYRGADACLADHPAYRDLADAAQSLARLLLARALAPAPAPPFHARAPFDRHMHVDPRERLRRNNPRLHALTSRVAHIAALTSDDDMCAVAALRVLVEVPPNSALVLACGITAAGAPEMRLLRDLRLCALRCLAHSAELAAVARNAPDAVSSTASSLFFQ